MKTAGRIVLVCFFIYSVELHQAQISVLCKTYSCQSNFLILCIFFSFKSKNSIICSPQFLSGIFPSQDSASCAGHRDVPLSEVGMEQANLVAKRLQNEHFTHIFASDLKRAAETAQAIVKAGPENHCPIQLDKRLRERVSVT